MLFALAALLFLGAGIGELSPEPRLGGLLLIVAAVHAAVALACLAVCKSVRVSDRFYFISNGLRSEIVPFNDVCLTVDASGVLWDRVRIHFRRPTRFGWCVSYVPANPASRYES